MADEKPVPELDPEFFEIVGNIAHDWASLEYMANASIWQAAMVDQQLGACITAQIFSLPPRLEALVLLLRARGVSDKLMSDLNDFIASSRYPTEVRNRVVHDPLGVHKSDGEARQLQITGRGKLVFELRKFGLPQLREDAKTISAYLERFMALRDRIEAELPSLPYTSQQLFPSITRHPTERH
jgi:hypothetical protein